MRHRKTASRHFLYGAAQPGNHDIFPGGGKFGKVSPAIMKFFRTGATLGIYGNDGGKMPRPLAFGKILVIARGDDVSILEVRSVDPIFVIKDVILAAATKAAVDDVVSAFDRQKSGGANNHA